MLLSYRQLHVGVVLQAGVQLVVTVEVLSLLTNKIPGSGEPAVELGSLLGPVVGASGGLGILLICPDSLQASSNLDARAEAIGCSGHSAPDDAVKMIFLRCNQIATRFA